MKTYTHTHQNQNKKAKIILKNSHISVGVPKKCSTVISSLSHYRMLYIQSGVQDFSMINRIQKFGRSLIVEKTYSQIK